MPPASTPGSLGGRPRTRCPPTRELTTTWRASTAGTWPRSPRSPLVRRRRPCGTPIRVASDDDATARGREAGGRVLSEPFDVFDAGRMGVFADPEGAVFCVWQPGSHRGSAAVNEHGAVNFNNLHTDDVEAARAFYGSVFGWTTIDAGSPMWAL